MIETCIFADEVSKDFEEAVRLCVAAGARCIEVRGGVWQKHIREVNDTDIARMKEVLQKHGARIAVIGANVGKCDMMDDAQCASHVAEFRRMAELAHQFGTNLIRGFAFWNPTWRTERKRAPLAAYLPRVVERLRPIAEIAEREKVLLLLETEPSTMVGTCDEARRVIDALGSSAVAFAWDVNNAVSCGERPYPDGYQRVKGFIRHLHVKPNANKNLLTIADFPMSYEALIRVLISDGYSGYATIEHWGSPELMLEGARQLSTLLARIQ